MKLFDKIQAGNFCYRRLWDYTAIRGSGKKLCYTLSEYSRVQTEGIGIVGGQKFLENSLNGGLEWVRWVEFLFISVREKFIQDLKAVN